MGTTNTCSIISRLNYDPTSSDAKGFVQTYADKIVEFAAQYHNLNDNLNEILDGIDNITRLIDNPLELAVNDVLSIEGYGHFKECYYLAPDFVLKFCARRNPTIDEKNVYDAAITQGLGHFFVPSLYIPLPFDIPSECLEKDDEDMEVWDDEKDEWVENPDWQDNSDFNYICIQPRITVEGEENEPDPPYNCIYSCSAAHWEATKSALCLPDTITRYDLRGLDGVNLPWAKRFLNHYGFSAFLKLSLFCENYHVWDLHSENVGYSRDSSQRPLILDWMSR